jgi:hypothetical protein
MDRQQIAEAEVVHRPGDRSNVVGIARADENDGQAVEFVLGEHSWLILWLADLPRLGLGCFERYATQASVQIPSSRLSGRNLVAKAKNLLRC